MELLLVEDDKNLSVPVSRPSNLIMITHDLQVASSTKHSGRQAVHRSRGYMNSPVGIDE